VNPRAGLDDMEKRKFLSLPGPELDPSGGSQSLFRLRYPGLFALIAHGGSCVHTVLCVPAVATYVKQNRLCSKM
jgi:hypothetical protein